MANSKWAGQVKGRSDRLVARMGQNDSGTQLAQAQTTSSGLDSGGKGNVIIAPSTVTNSSTSTNPMYASETSFKDDEHRTHQG
jgi:hypothetical protein